MRIAMIAITTSNSMSVNPRRRAGTLVRIIALSKGTKPHQTMKTHITSFLLPALFSVAFHAHGAPGDLDASFGGTGTTRVGFGFGEDYGRAMAVQADGKLVVAGFSGGYQGLGGSFSVVRYGTNNLPDPTFGFSGKVITPVSADAVAVSGLM